MMKIRNGRKLIHGLNCPSCGGPLDIPEGSERVVCPHCDVSSLLVGKTGVWRFQVRRQLDRERARNLATRFLGGAGKAEDLRRQATVQDCIPVYFPYWRARAHAVAWFVLLQWKSWGKYLGFYYPLERSLADDVVWMDPACDVTAFGFRRIEVKVPDMEPYDPASLEHEALVFRPTEIEPDARDSAQQAFADAMRAKVIRVHFLNQRPRHIRFERVQFLRETLCLLYYPLWLVRYTYRGRDYQLVLDGVNGRVLHGRAPGSLTLRAAVFALTWAAGAALPVDGLMWLIREMYRMTAPYQANQAIWAVVFAGRVIPYSMAFYWLAYAIAVCILAAGYALLRFGGERLVGERRSFDRYKASLNEIGRLTFTPAALMWVGWFIAAFISPVLPRYREVSILLSSAVAAVIGLWLAHRGSLKTSQPAARTRQDNLMQLFSADNLQIAPDAVPELHPSRCPHCSTPIRLSENEFVYRCSGCGWWLELTSEGLCHLEVHLAECSSPLPIPGVRHIPLWVFDAQVEICDRKAITGMSSTGKPRSSVDSGDMWDRVRQFYVPALDLPVHETTYWGEYLTANPAGNSLIEGDAPTDIDAGGCYYSEEEARRLAKLIFLGIEFHKDDVLTDLDYRLNLSRPRLLIVPVKETSPRRRMSRLPNEPTSSKWEQSPFVSLLVITPGIAVVLLMIVLILLAILFLLPCQNGALLKILPR